MPSNYLGEPGFESVEGDILSAIREALVLSQP